MTASSRRPAREPRRHDPARARLDRAAARRRRPRGHLAGLVALGTAAGAGRRSAASRLGRGRAGLAAARPRARGARGWPSPAPTARPPPCRCSRRCCAPAACAPSPRGNVGLPIVEAVMDPEPWDVLAVELSSFQLHWTSSMKAESAAVLNVAEDHLDWYAGPTRWPTTPRDKGRIYSGVERACVYNVADPVTEQLVRDADVQRGRPGDRLHPRHPGRRHARRGRRRARRPGLRRRPADQRRRAVHPRPTSPARRRTTSPTRSPRRPSRASHGVSTGAVQQALREFRPDGHRIAEVAVVDEVTWIDDSKATNPHAALASLQAYDPVVWVAGRAGQGRHLRRPGRRGARPAAGRGAARPGRPGDPRLALRDTRPMCP